MIPRRKPVSADAQRKHHADEELAGRFEELLAGARDAEQELRDAEAARLLPPTGTGWPSSWTRR